MRLSPSYFRGFVRVSDCEIDRGLVIVRVIVIVRVSEGFRGLWSGF